MEFDAILFGNGLTLNYQNQVMKMIPEKYIHSLYFETYVNAIVNDSISKREKNNLKKIFKDKYRYSYDVLVSELVAFNNTFKNGYEYTWGKLLTTPNSFSKYEILFDCVPVLYNLWYCNLKSLLNCLELRNTSIVFANSIKKHLKKGGRIFTTNFDGFFDSINPEHIHGHFIENFSNYRDLCWHTITDDDFYYPFIWAPSDVAKIKMIEEYSVIDNNTKHFNFSFFHKPFHANTVLIYGISFAKAGYMNGLEKYNQKYKSFNFGTCIDDHIILRLKTLQESTLIGQIIFSYYDEQSKHHYEKIIEDYGLKKASVIPTNDLLFSIESNTH